MKTFDIYNVTINVSRKKDYCLPVQKVFNEHIDIIWIQIIFGILYTTIVLFGLLANCATLHCLLLKLCKIDLNVKFLVNLNLSGILIGITSLPITAIQIFYRQWLWGWTMCHIVPLLQVTVIKLYPSYTRKKLSLIHIFREQAFLSTVLLWLPLLWIVM